MRKASLSLIAQLFVVVVAVFVCLFADILGVLIVVVSLKMILCLQENLTFCVVLQLTLRRKLESGNKRSLTRCFIDSKCSRRCIKVHTYNDVLSVCMCAYMCQGCQSSAFRRNSAFFFFTFRFFKNDFPLFLKNR